VFIEMLDLLRCTAAHEETWLVASFAKMQDRFVIEGKLGCPVCTATYDIAGGIPEFGRSMPEDAGAPFGDDDVFRYAAMLGMVKPGGTAVIEGSAAALASTIASVTDSRILCPNPAAGVEESERVGLIASGDRIPLATASVDAIALSDPRFIAEAARILKPGGRLVAPSTVGIGESFTELARDSTHAVAEKSPDVVQLDLRRTSSR
jgi:uncharacterized protein YbaR (Trm112 family)